MPKATINPEQLEQDTRDKQLIRYSNAVKTTNKGTISLSGLQNRIVILENLIDELAKRIKDLENNE